MSRSDDTATRLLHELASLELPPDAPRRAATRRGAAVARMRWLIKADPRSIDRRWWVGLAAAAAVLVAVFAWWRSGPTAVVPPVPVAATPAGNVLARGDGTELVRDGRTRAIHASGTAMLQPADVLQTGASSSATVATAAGVAVDVQAATRLRVEPSQAGPGHERMGLMFGRIEVDVPEDGRKREFAVQTPQATVVVHGTRFTVEVTRGESSGQLQTSVRVQRGRVGVLTAGGETTVSAGSTWSSRQGHLPTEAVKPRVGAAVSRDASPSAASHPQSAPPPDESSLAEQNAIYARAMQAKQRGDEDRVLAVLDTLLHRFPDSPLVPDARVERFRALQRLGRTEEAARSARQYLAEQPDGFAKDEARDVALGRPTRKDAAP